MTETTRTLIPIRARIRGKVVDFDTDEAKFAALAEAWLDEQAGRSVVPMRSDHYLQIIGMGEAAIPYLLRGVRDETGHWFTALKMITGETLVTDEMRGDYVQMKDVWLLWGARHGYGDGTWNVDEGALPPPGRE